MKSKCFRPKVRPGLLCMGDADAWCAKGEHYDDKDPSCEFAETRGWVRTEVAPHSPVVSLPLRRRLQRAWVSSHSGQPGAQAPTRSRAGAAAVAQDRAGAHGKGEGAGLG